MKITYILGAGASANALPLIKRNSNSSALGLTHELDLFVDKFTSHLLSHNSRWDLHNIEILKEVTQKCIEFGTPDLYAKFLLEIGDNLTYHLLKSLLSIYFKYKQEIEKCFDFRALTFLTTISEKKKIPDSIRVISWNYDSQIEIAAEKLKPIRSASNNKIRGFTCWPNMRDGHERNFGQPFLLHLNGIAGAVYAESDFYEKIGANFTFELFEDKEHLLSFAWEDESTYSEPRFVAQRLTVACEIAVNTEILVVVGYSFPFFNRKLDQEIFKHLKPTLKKIYFQDPFNDGSQLITQFDLSPIASSNIEHVKQIDNYHIPYEL
jgi:hypothetical protein